MKNGITEGAVNKATSISAKPNLEQEINNSKANGIKIISDQTQKADMPNSMDDTKPNVVKTPQEQLKQLKIEQAKYMRRFSEIQYDSFISDKDSRKRSLVFVAQIILDKEKEIERLQNELPVEVKALTKTYSGNNPVLKLLDKMRQRFEQFLVYFDQEALKEQYSKKTQEENENTRKQGIEKYRKYVEEYSKKEKTNKEINNDFRDSLYIEQNILQSNTKSIAKSTNINVKRNGIQEINNDFRDSLHIEQNTPQLNSKSIAKSTNINVKRKGIQEVNRDI